MSRKHFEWEIEAYLDGRLSKAERYMVEAHLAVCQTCTKRLSEARRVDRMLRPTLKQALGRPTLPATLQRRPDKPPHRSRGFSPLLNGLGSIVVIVLLAVGALLLIQNWFLSESRPMSGSSTRETVTPTTAPPTVLATPSPLPTLPTIITGLTATPTIEPESQAALAGETGPSSASPTTLPTRSGSTVVETPQKTTPIANQTSVSSPIVEPPSGWIAFAYYNPAPQRRTYEIHLLRPDGSDHHLFPLDSVSEPALHPTEGNQLAYRAWGDPGGPRSLLSSNLSAQAQHQIGGFWEDAQPDWSPQGDQLIYASQREQDRRWRLYTSRSDGTGEIDLPFEGRSPSFAPDGQRFVYEGCDPTGNRCGLWQASLDDLRAGATLLLEDAQAKSPDWSPDGESILYMAQANGNWDLYRLDLTTNEIGRLTSDPAIDGLPVWSPDGEWLAFLSNRDGNWGIWRYRLSDGATKLIFAFDGGSFIPPAAHYGERNWWDEQLSWGP